LVPFFTNVSPFLINIIAVSKLLKMPVNEKSLHFMSFASIGIFAIFMYFPFEDYKISATKFSIFILIFFGIIIKSHKQILKVLAYCLFILFVFICYSSTSRLLDLNKTNFNSTYLPSSNNQSLIYDVINLPLNNSIYHELKNQINLLSSTVSKDPYFILSGPTHNLMTLPILFDNNYTQYYVRFDPEILNSEVFEAVISEIRTVPYVIISSNDYNDYLLAKNNNFFLARLIEYVTKNFSIAAKYEKEDQSVHTQHIDNFIIFKKI
jgi:hypothetical protein